MSNSPRGDWNPQQYEKFADERAQPFHDLLALVTPRVFERAVDLGCGTGELTALATNQLQVREMVGIDNSPAMLGIADQYMSAALHFVRGDIAQWTGNGAPVDLVIANASLQWVPDHRSVLRLWVSGLRAGGQIAVQVPTNAEMPSHTVITEVARLDRFADAFGAAGPPEDPVAGNVLEPEEYASILHELGCTRQHVRLQVYPHLLTSSHSVVDWVRGTTLTRFQKVLDEATFAIFVEEYERRLIATIGEHEPYFFPFRRILMWGRLPG